MKPKKKYTEPQPNFHPFERISQRVQADHHIYGPHVASLMQFKRVNEPLIKDYVEKLMRHKAECPLCTCPRLYAFGRWCARTWQILRARIRL